ncbi:MAG: hypothetical protein HYU29_05775 [Chloroflexi bacterium]|nr:hypothetical protein [Chloroflexota bacterium]
MAMAGSREEQDKETIRPEIREALVRAFEVVTARSGGPRLVPFTPAQLRFLQEVMGIALVQLLPRRTDAGR